MDRLDWKWIGSVSLVAGLLLGMVLGLQFAGVTGSDSPATVLAYWVQAIAMFAAAVIAWYATTIAQDTIRKARKNQREATAKELWHSYEKMAFKNPMFASPPEHPEVSIDLQGKTITLDGETLPSNKPRLRYEKYEWYVSLMLNACEEIFLLRLKREDWKETMATQIGFHFEYIEYLISESGTDYLNKHYDPNFVNFAKHSCTEARKQISNSVSTGR